jgi:hypothetical protein
MYKRQNHTQKLAHLPSSAEDMSTIAIGVPCSSNFVAAVCLEMGRQVYKLCHKWDYQNEYLAANVAGLRFVTRH